MPISSGTRFIGFSTNADLTERKTANINSLSEPFTAADIANFVGPGATGPQGVQGPAGPIGPVGPAGLTWRGAWASGTSYVANDSVGYDGASWFCILATSGTSNPSVDTTHWALLAAQGAQGPQGVQGPTGPQGAGATQTLQQTVDLGNTVADLNYTTSLIPGSVYVLDNNDSSGALLQPNSLNLFNGSYAVVLNSPNTLSETRTIEFPNANGTIQIKNYKSYVALISQSGTSNPTATIVFNDTTGTIVFTRSGVGLYSATISGTTFTADKTVVFLTPGLNGSGFIQGIRAGRLTNSKIDIVTSGWDGSDFVLQDGQFNCQLEIRVYN